MYEYAETNNELADLANDLLARNTPIHPDCCAQTQEQLIRVLDEAFAMLPDELHLPLIVALNVVVNAAFLVAAPEEDLEGSPDMRATAFSRLARS